MLLNHPEIIPCPHSPSVEKLSSTKPVPGAKKFGDCYSKPIPEFFFFEWYISLNSISSVSYPVVILVGVSQSYSVLAEACLPIKQNSLGSS